MPPVASFTTQLRTLKCLTDHESSILHLAWAATLYVFISERNVQFQGRVRGSLKSLNISIDTQKAISEALTDIHHQLRNLCVDCAPTVNSSDWKFGSLLDVTTSEPSDHDATITKDPDSGAPLVLQCRLGEDSTQISLVANALGPSSWQVQRMIYQFSHFMEQLQSSPERKLVSILTPSPEDHALLLIRNGQMAQLTRIEACIHDMISTQFQAQPDREAICAWDTTMTYRELEIQSKLLSLQLVKAGAGPEVVVPVLFEKSGWTPVVMLAVLFAGAAFVLFDPSFPDDRLKAMCEDIGATVGVCSAQHACRGEAIGLKEVIIPSIVNQKLCNFSPAVVYPWNMAYIAFSSGSTGKPKGTVIEHAAFCTSAMAYGEAFRYTATSRVLQFASYGFDASVGEILAPLMRGGCVCVPSENERQQDLAMAAQRLNANSAFLTPAVLRTLNHNDFPSLSTITCGGEKVMLNDIQSWADEKVLMNVYGPSECSVISSATRNLQVTSDPANIGYPTGCHFWIVDRNDSTRLAPVGAVGELIIEGPIVGREYINRPEETAKAFFRNPPWLHSFRRSPWSFYRTGDMVQLEPDGSMRILGRKDHQVKLHGQRIELTEVEHAIHKVFPNLQRVMAAVVNRSSPVLVVFLVGVDGDAGDQESESARSTFLKPSRTFQHSCQVAVATCLRQCLPEFMIPRLWFPLDKPPLTPNGKVDARRLAAEVADLSPEQALRYTLCSGDRRIAVQGMEERLQCWVAEALGVQQEQIALDASFFGQGGDSLTSMKSSALARKEGVVLSPAALQEANSLAELAQKLDEQNHSPTGKDQQLSLQIIEDTEGSIQDALLGRLSGISPDNIQYILPVSELQEFFLDLPCEYFRFDLRGPLDRSRLQAAFQSLHKRHEILRTVVFRDAKDDRAYQAVLREFTPQLEVLETDGSLLTASDEWIYKDFQQANTQNQCPLWPAARYLLVKKSEQLQENCLVIGIKHTHYDGVSIITFLNDLASLYQHGPESLPPTFSFGQYQAFVASLPMSKTIDFWRETLRGSSVTQVGRERAVAPVPVVETTRHIPQVHPPLGITLATTVKTAWAICLAQQVGKNDIVFAQIVSGRSQGPDGIQRVIGPCMNSIPVRVSLALKNSGQSAMEIMQQVQSQHVQSLFHETIGFTTLRDECTSWGPDAVIESLVLHQNILHDDEYRLGEAVGKMDTIYPELVTDEFILYSVPRGDRHEFRLSVPQRVLDLPAIEHLVTETCHWVQALAAHPEMRISQLMLERKSKLHAVG
ncbi:hypothetical protein N7510_006930 [Penicillium lagena]|uniref:uncharacterized protein n=1 Tax=Penicillium lagena TaxID=94218 RepID=UPI0025426639|nr:uncharacterized protein N7510_006930 [Penicillium lagena]KAJ5610211.1 hypothetical protein N7510_006930 [Penicillium lagena]